MTFFFFPTKVGTVPAGVCWKYFFRHHGNELDDGLKAQLALIHSELDPEPHTIDLSTNNCLQLFRLRYQCA